MLDRNNDFSDLITAKKAGFAEPIVDRHIESMGWIPYRPTIENIAHPIDRIWFDRNKRTIVIADTKAKARREFYPDTGIDHRCFLDYHFIYRRYGFPCYLVFVDERDGAIYGETLQKLYETQRVRGQRGWLLYPRIEHTEANGQDYFIIYFPLKFMRTIGKLSDQQRSELARLSTRNPEYDREPRFDL